MQNNKKKLGLGISVCALLLLIACTGKENHNTSTESNSATAEKQYYSITDLQSIVVGESELLDVYRIAPDATYLAVSYGTLCELPTKDGKYIHIQFWGPDMLVGRIEVVEESVVAGKWKPSAG